MFPAVSVSNELSAGAIVGIIVAVLFLTLMLIAAISLAFVFCDHLEKHRVEFKPPSVKGLTRGKKVSILGKGFIAH